LKEEINLPGGKKFSRRVLKRTGFKFKKCKSKWSFLMERNYIVCGGQPI
jgi:hypothetical protein